MESSKIEKILVYLVTIVIIGLVSYIFLRVEKSVDQNTSAVGVLSERVAKLEASISLISKIDSGSGRVHTPELQITELLNVEGIKFKVRMASELDKDGSPVELRKRFSLRKDKRMYVHLEWLDQAGEHRVVVRWIMPDRRIYTENIYDTNFEESTWSTWHWQKLYPEMPKGTWFVEILLDGKLLVTKSFTMLS